MKKMLLFFIALIFGIGLYAQNKQDQHLMLKENNINLNILGDASVISLNYERLFFFSPNKFISSNLGIGINSEFQLCWNPPCRDPRRFLTIPHRISINFGKNRRFFECGLGGTVLLGDTNENYYLYPIIGYRVQPGKSKKNNFRLFVSIPFSGFETEYILWIPVGVSFGKLF